MPKIEISPEHEEVLKATLRRKMPLNPLKIRVECKLTCTSYDGIEIIKEALLTAKHQLNDEEWKLDFKMDAAPIYRIEVLTLSKAKGEEKLKQAQAIIKKVMKKNGGKFDGGEPKIIGTKQEE